MEQVTQLLLQVSDGSEECSKSVLRESLKYLKNVLSDRPKVRERHLLWPDELVYGFSEILLSWYKKLCGDRHKIRILEVNPEREIVVME